MSDDLNTEIKIGADASGVEAGVGRAKRSLATLGDAAKKAGSDGGKGMELLGSGSDKAAAKVESATRSMQNSIQRLIAEQSAGAKGTREYYEALADTKGISRNALKPLLDQLDAAKRKTEAAQGASKNWLESLRGVNGVLAGIGVGVSIGGITSVIKQTIDAADSFSKLSAKSGVAVESLRELNFAASLSDVSTESLGTGLRKLSQNMAAAAGGSKQQAAAFDAIGVSVTKADGSLKGADTTLKELASKFATFKDGPEKAALAIELFGKQGAELIPLLNGGAAGLADMADEANRLGIVFDGDLAKNAEAFNDNITRIQTSVQGAAVSITRELLPTLNILAQAFVDADSGSQSFASAIGSGFRVVLEAATILIANVSFTLKGFGREIAAVGAQFAALGRGDFSGFRAISEAVKEDGVRARKELDKFQFDLLNARILTSKAGGGRGTAPDPRALGVPDGISAPIVKQAEAATKAAKAVASEYDKLIQSIKAKTAATEAEYEGGKKLNDAEKMRVELLGKMNAGLLKLTATEKQNVLAAVQAYDVRLKDTEAAKEALALAVQRQQVRAKESEGIEAYMRAQTDAQVATVKAANDAVTAAQFEFDTYGKSKSQLAELTLARLQDKLAGVSAGTEIAKSIEAQIDAQKRLIGILSQGEARDAGEKAAKATADEWQKTADSINNGLTDSLFRAFESGKGFFKTFWDGIKNLFKTTVLKLAVQGVVGGFAGGGAGIASAASSLLGGGGGGAGGLGGIGNLLGSGISSAITGGLSAGFGGLTGSIGSLFGAAGTGATLGGSLSAGGIAMGAGNIVGGLSTIVGALGPIALGIGIVATLLKGKKDSRFGSQYEYVAGSDTQIVGGPNKGADYGGQKSVQDATIATINSLLTRVGSGQQLGNFASGFESSDKGKGFSYAGGTFANGVTFGQGATGRGFENNRGSKKPEQAMAEYADELAQATLQALQSASDIPKSIAAKLEGVNIDALTGDALKAFVASIDKQITEVESFRAAVASLPFAVLRDLSFDAAAGLLAAGGGLEALSQNLTGYYQNFYSEEEQRQQKIKDINNATAGTGLDAATATRAEFRAIFNALDLTTESGQKSAAALLSVQGAFASLTPALDAAASAVAGISNTLKTLLSDRAGLEADILDAQGNASGAALARRAIATKGFTGDEVAGFDYNESLREQAVFLRNIADAAKTAAADAIATAKAAADAETQRIAGVAQERNGLQDQLNALTDTSTQALKRQRDSLDESNRALFDQVEAVKKSAAISTERTGLQDQLNALTDTSAEALNRQRNALDESNRALFDQVEAAKAAAAATAAFSSAMSGLSNTKIDLQAQLLTLQGNTGAANSMIRERDIAQLIKGLTPEDAKTVTAQFDSNNVLRQQIADLQAAQAAQASASQAATQAAEQTAQAANSLRSAMQSLANTLFDEVNRIRGLISGDSQQSLIQAQARFALNTVLARAGDQDAAKLLPTLSQTLLTIAEAQATSLVDLNRIRGRTAGSLEETGGQIAAQFGLKVPSEVTAAPELYITAASSSNQQLLTSLIELQKKMDLMVEAQERGNESTSTSAKMLQGQQTRPLLVELAQ